MNLPTRGTKLVLALMAVFRGCVEGTRNLAEIQRFISYRAWTDTKLQHIFTHYQTWGKMSKNPVLMSISTESQMDLAIMEGKIWAAKPLRV